MVKGHAITVDDLAEYVRFDPARYHRELMINADDYQILVLGWLPGQKSPIHNHRGSQCCVRVLQGTAVETVYTHTRDGTDPISLQNALRKLAMNQELACPCCQCKYEVLIIEQIGDRLLIECHNCLLAFVVESPDQMQVNNDNDHSHLLVIA